MTGVALGLAGVLLALAVALTALSPGRLAPLRDADGRVIPGSISERVTMDIGGVQQGMFIQSADPANPVLLFLHGGPGMPEFFLETSHPTGLALDFTVVWWEQRGAGMSWNPDISPDTMTVPQLIADTITVTNYLRSRFNQDKIYLLGHSWGSYLGIQVAATAPDLYHAYIGMGQVSYQLQSEVAAHAALIAAYRARGDAGMVRTLEAAAVSIEGGLSDAWLRLRDKAMHRIGAGTTRDMRSVITGVFLPVWFCRAYTLREKISVWRGLGFSRRYLWDEFLNTDLTRQIDHLDLPVYFFSGRHDLTANRDLSRAFFDRITAPVKGFYTFENSAHSPLFEEPERARDILLTDILQQTIRLSDTEE